MSKKMSEKYQDKMIELHKRVQHISDNLDLMTVQLQDSLKELHEELGTLYGEILKEGD